MFYAIESNYSGNLLQEDGTHAGVVYCFESVDDLRDFCRDAEEWNGNYRFRISRHEAYRIMEGVVKPYGYRRGEDFSTVSELRTLYTDCVNRWW